MEGCSLATISLFSTLMSDHLRTGDIVTNLSLIYQTKQSLVNIKEKEGSS